MQETQVQFLSQEDTLKKGMVTHSRILAWRILWTEEPVRLQSLGLQRARHNWATKHGHTVILWIKPEKKRKTGTHVRGRRRDCRGAISGWFWFAFPWWFSCCIHFHVHVSHLYFSLAKCLLLSLWPFFNQIVWRFLLFSEILLLLIHIWQIETFSHHTPCQNQVFPFHQTYLAIYSFTWTKAQLKTSY